MIKLRRRSIITVDDGGGTPKTTANSTTTTFRQRGRGRRATTRRQNLELQESANQGQPLGQNSNISGENDESDDEEIGCRRKTNRRTRTRPTTMNYIEIKNLIERRTLANKKGKLTDEEIKSLVKEWHDHRAEGELNQETVEREIRAMEKTVANYNVEQLGSIPVEREDGAMRILVCQMGGMASPEARAIKIAATRRLIKNITSMLYYLWKLI